MSTNYPDYNARKANAASDFGCPLDGTSDARPAIQTGIDALASRGGGVLQLPPVALALGDTLYARNGVVLEGTGGTPPALDTGLAGSVLYPLGTSLNTAITQADLTNPLHSFEMRHVGIDGQYRNGKTVNYGLLISGINCRFDSCYIRSISGTGIYNKTNTVASWINWFTNNMIEACNRGIQYEGTDSYFTSNYITASRDIGMFFDSTGNNVVSGGMIDNGGFNSSGQTANTNAIAMKIQNMAELSKGSSYAQISMTITGTRFIANPWDIMVMNSGPVMSTAISITGCLFHDGRGGNPITIFDNNNGGIIANNIFHSEHANGSACITFEGNSNCAGWLLGPNAFSDVSIIHMANVPDDSQVIGTN
jgi:hypothetical protein